MNRISAKRKATTKLGFNSTFTAKPVVISASEFIQAVKKPKKRKEEITYPQAEKMLDAAFSQWVRLKSSDENGFVRCFICGIRMRWNRSVLMHFQSRTCLATQWDEIGCQAGCQMCNGKDLGDRSAFARRIDEDYGSGTADALMIKSKKSTKYTTIDLLTRARWYRERIKHIRQNSPGKFRD